MQTTTVIETIPAPQMAVRIIEAIPAYLGYSIQYEYAREGRAKLYGGTQTQQWRTITADGRKGEWGPKCYETVALARAAAKRVIRNNNGPAH